MTPSNGKAGQIRDPLSFARDTDAVARSADSPVLGKVHNVQESLAERD